METTLLNSYGPFFKEEEFTCHCGLCEYPGMDQLLLDKLSQAREAAGVSFVITSGYRCKDYNRAIGGSRNSSHMAGLAVDIAAVSPNRRMIIVDSLLSYFNRVGIASDFIHVDIDTSKRGDCMWVY